MSIMGGWFICVIVLATLGLIYDMQTRKIAQRHGQREIDAQVRDRAIAALEAECRRPLSAVIRDAERRAVYQYEREEFMYEVVTRPN